MGATKHNIYTKETNHLAAIAKVLAHPARIEILNYISKQPECICTDISEEIGLSQPTTSQHLQVMRRAGILKGKFEGKSFSYCIDLQELTRFQESLHKFFTSTAAKCC
ncbi:hypothetical protein GCM10009117_20810 [Gangjinia marincola]|uniref:HTH arsR-type domain-containing protein n=1 Tax=Gangjinia marincola TaxID=578463 RepID=A0ABP3XYK6_9FLAO